MNYIFTFPKNSLKNIEIEQKVTLMLYKLVKMSFTTSIQFTYVYLDIFHNITHLVGLTLDPNQTKLFYYFSLRKHISLIMSGWIISKILCLVIVPLLWSTYTQCMQ